MLVRRFCDLYENRSPFSPYALGKGLADIQATLKLLDVFITIQKFSADSEFLETFSRYTEYLENWKIAQTTIFKYNLHEEDANSIRV